MMMYLASKFHPTSICYSSTFEKSNFLFVALRERIKTDSPKEASMILILTSFNNSEHLKRVIEIAMKVGQCSYTSNLVFHLCTSFGIGQTYLGRVKKGRICPFLISWLPGLGQKVIQKFKPVSYTITCMRYHHGKFDNNPTDPAQLITRRVQYGLQILHKKWFL